MSTPRFSLAVPTRERAATLHFCLRTCLEHDFDDFEVLVCDNHSSPSTRKVVEAFSSPRVRYVRAPRPLSMSANWELAVSQTRGEYVLVLGDDDGLLPHALSEIDQLIRQSGARAVRWKGAYYSWPTIDLPGQANYLRVPLGRAVGEKDWRSAVAAVARFEACYSTLPMLYNSAVRRDLLDEVRRRGGKVFRNQYPDVYSGFVIAHAAGTYLASEAPMTVAGTSGGSYGVATLFHRGRSPLDREFRTQNRDDGLPTHPWVADLPIFPWVPVADSFLLAKEALFPQEDGLRLDRRALAVRCVDGLRADTQEQWQAALAAIRASFADDPESQAWFDSDLGKRPFRPAPPVRLRPERLAPEGDCLNLDVAGFGVADVYAATRLVERLLGYPVAGNGSDNPPPATHHPPRTTRHPDAAEPVAELQASEIRAFELLSGHVNVRRMLDVGAHHGSTLEPFLHMGWDVWAFEPVEANRTRLLERVGASERLRLRSEAVSDREGSATLHLALHLDGSPHDYYHSLERTRADRYHRKGGGVEVPLVSLDGLIERGELPDRVGLLKVDTEGHDLAVLRGAGRLECEAVAVEFWGDRHPLGPSPSPADQTVRLMAGRGYRNFLVLCHQGEGTSVADSTLDGVGPAAWGNLLFFHPSRTDLHQLLLRELRAPAPTAGAAPLERRLMRLLGLVFPKQDGLRVAYAGSGGAEFVAGLRGAFPRSAGGEFSTAGRADVLWLGPGPDLGTLLPSVVGGPADRRPAVVARVTPESFAVAAELGKLGYHLAGIFNALVSEEGAFGHADLVLLPPALHARCEAARGAFGFEDPEALLEQARLLQQACDDRLAEIEGLRATNDERLGLIQYQHNLIEALKEARDRRSPARRLLKAVRRLWRGPGPRHAA